MVCFDQHDIKIAQLKCILWLCMLQTQVPCKKSLINLNLFGKRIVKVTIVNPSRQYTRSHLNAFQTLTIDVRKKAC